MMTRLLVGSVTCRLRCFPFPTPLKIKAITNTINRSTNDIDPSRAVTKSHRAGSAGQVDFLAGKVTFEAYLTNGQETTHLLMKSLTNHETSQK